MEDLQLKRIEIGRNLKELTSHRTVTVPVACYETTIRQNIQGYIPLHWHDELQFVCVLKGEAVFRVNEETIVVKEGNGLFINSGRLHMAEDPNQSGCVYICLNVSPHFVLSPELFTIYVYPYIQSTNLSYVWIDSTHDWGKSILNAILNIRQTIQQEPQYYEIDIGIQLAHIWKNLITNGFRLVYDQAEAVKHERMKNMLNWIHHHFNEKILLEDIARAGQLSRSECCRYFKRMLKTTPLRYVNDYRIQKSVVLLQQADLNVSDVAYQVGFNSTSYFIDHFRRLMNMTPLAYRKNNGQGGKVPPLPTQ